MLANYTSSTFVCKDRYAACVKEKRKRDPEKCITCSRNAVEHRPMIEERCEEWCALDMQKSKSYNVSRKTGLSVSAS